MEKQGKNHFLKTNSQFENVIKASFDSEYGTKLSELFQFVEDLILWFEILNSKIDTTILTSVVNEYELGFQAVAHGQYRHAFMSNRYFLEQICRFIYLSTNELYLRQWKLGLREVAWGSLVDKENGIFSKIFIRAFFPEVESEGEHMIKLVSSLYRETSEFIHGNFSKMVTISSKIEFKPELLKSWLKFMETNKFVSTFLLFMRFSKDCKREDIHKLEDLAKDELGGIEEFNVLFI